MLKKVTHYKVCVYVGGLASTNIVEILDTTDKGTAYAKLQQYCNEHPECVKAYIDEK